MDTPVRKEIVLQGRAVSPGIARGHVSLWGRRWARPVKQLVFAADVEKEVLRLENAIAETVEEVKVLRKGFEGDQTGVAVDVFEAHELLLQDLTVLEEVGRRIRQEKCVAEYAFYDVLQGYMEALLKVHDDYLSARAIDIEDVGSRVLAHLRGQTDTRRFASQLQEDSVLLAWDMTPSDTAQLGNYSVSGFATEAGSPNSHTAIIARAIGTPAVVGVENLLKQAVVGREVLVDGYGGKIIFNPSAETYQKYLDIKARRNLISAELAKLKSEDARTEDGRDIVLSANLELEQELGYLEPSGASGVGLYRTEFFFFENKGVPSEEAQLERYLAVTRAAGEHGVIIRTFDVGGDKLLPEGMLAESGEVEENPALGWRGIRVCLDREQLFKIQMRAILRAGAEGKVRIMFPMVSGISELLRARALLEECAEELTEEGLAFDANLEVGVMIEVPSAALLADQMAKYVDFFSIGTNDLAQYTMAVDRTNEKVSGLHQVCHPAILRLLANVVNAAHRQGIWVGICGEAAGDLELTPLLVGLDLDEFSVGIHQVAAIKAAIRKLNADQCRETVKQALNQETTAPILTASWAIADQAYGDLL